MTVTKVQAEKVLKGNQAFSQMGFSMLVTRLKSQYSKDSSAVKLEAYTQEMNNFFEKFKSIMSEDYAVITKM